MKRTYFAGKSKKKKQTNKQTMQKRYMNFLVFDGAKGGDGLLEMLKIGRVE